MASVTEEQLRKEFARLDKDNDGSITVEELRKYYMPMQEMLGIHKDVAEQEIQGMLKRLDNDHSGTISFEGETRGAFAFVDHVSFFRIQIVLHPTLVRYSPSINAQTFSSTK